MVSATGKTIWNRPLGTARTNGPFGEVFPTRAFPSTDFTRAGLFAGDDISIADGRLILYPALRFDWYDLSPDDAPLLPAFSGAGQAGSLLSPHFGSLWKKIGRASCRASVCQSGWIAVGALSFKTTK